MLLAFIPARGGSKGIPRKNLAPLGGKPLVAHSIETAGQSASVDAILLSTDDDEIAAVGIRCGLDMRYRRPADLAADATSMIDALEHGLRWFERDRGTLPDEVMLLQPTSPLRSAADIDRAVDRFRREGARSLASVNVMHEHPSECIALGASGWSYLVPPPPEAVRRQDYENRFFYINGAIYLADVRTLLSRRRFIDRDTVWFEMPRARSVDVDSPLDLAIAAAILVEGA